MVQILEFSFKERNMFFKKSIWGIRTRGGQRESILLPPPPLSKILRTGRHISNNNLGHETINHESKNADLTIQSKMLKYDIFRSTHLYSICDHCNIDRQRTL